ncbi:MAG: cob(I)yrinic acid a,c-diamide adenosyltransferase [Sphingomonadaceae bacterium]
MVKLNKIYTRTGDDGTTGLVDGSRSPKDAPRMAAMGDVDELNATLGVVALHLDGEALARVRMIQNDLFDLGADLATPGDDFSPSDMVLRIVGAQVTRLEDELDAMNAALAPLTSFILPGGTPAGAALHSARTTCRRAERTAVAAAKAVPLNPLALAYLNRLSDYLFVMGRAVNSDGALDILWVPGGSR